VIALGLLASVWLLNPYPTGASCSTPDGYAAIQAHAHTNSLLAALAVSCAAIGAAVCIAGAVKAAGHRMEFVLGVVPFVGVAFFSLVLLIASGLYCQN
jgi:hypothetical protein